MATFGIGELIAVIQILCICSLKRVERLPTSPWEKRTGIIFEEQSSNDPKVYIELMSNEKVITGYTEGGVKKLTANSEFAPGTKVSIVAGSILIKTPVTDNITLRGL